MLLKQTLETLQAPEHQKQKQQVITAIKELGLKVTSGDVATRTALPVLKVNQILNNVAYETQGHLAVDTAGGVMYSFAPNFESHYLLNPTRHFFAWARRLAWNMLKCAFKLFVLATFMLLRISFGILLVLSVVLVIVLVVATIIGAIASLFNDGDSGGGDLNLDLGSDSSGLDWIGALRFWTFDWVWDWWYWGDFLWYDPSPVGYRRIVESEPKKSARKSKTNFLNNCFAVLFGVGNPNQNWDALRWGTVARVIKAHSGVVLAEDLAPYLDAVDKSENCMLPVLVHFNGFPEVSETGKLIYVFPTLIPDTQITETDTAARSSSNDLQNIYNRFIARQTVQAASEVQSAALPPYLEKEQRPLFGLSEGDAISVLAFAAIAVTGAVWLLTSWGNLQYIQMLRPALLAVAAYGGMFYLLPAMRWPFLMKENAQITAENEQRIEAARKLSQPDRLLRNWQAEAAQVRTALVSGEAKEIAYTTEEDALAQQFATPPRPKLPPLKLH